MIGLKSPPRFRLHRATEAVLHHKLPRLFISRRATEGLFYKPPQGINCRPPKWRVERLIDALKLARASGILVERLAGEAFKPESIPAAKSTASSHEADKDPE